MIEFAESDQGTIMVLHESLVLWRKKSPPPPVMDVRLPGEFKPLLRWAPEPQLTVTAEALLNWADFSILYKEDNEIPGILNGLTISRHLLAAGLSFARVSRKAKAPVRIARVPWMGADVLRLEGGSWVIIQNPIMGPHQEDVPVFPTRPPIEDRLTIARIRQEAPAWTWRAERMGRNWQYVGTLGARTVTVAPVAMVVGEDDYGTDWRVNEPGRSSVSWAPWCLAERPPEEGAWDPWAAMDAADAREAQRQRELAAREREAEAHTLYDDPVLVLSGQMDPAECAAIPTDLAANVDAYLYGGKDE